MTPLETARFALLDLHRAILDDEREEYERRNGRVTPAKFLEALTTQAEFRWLKPMTALILHLDDLLDAGPTEADRVDAMKRIKDLLRPDENGSEFQRRYADALQHSPEILVAHGAVMRAL